MTTQISWSKLQSFICFCFILIFAFAGKLKADVRLPSLISDNMVLQRGIKVPIWGWAKPNEHITIKGSWQKSDISTDANCHGKWLVNIEVPEAAGPYELTIKGENTIILENILAGEVWVCSGQSNMWWQVKLSNNPEQEIAAAHYRDIRLFTVQKAIAEQPQADCKGTWQRCSPQTIPEFSAVAYYFGKYLHKELDGVPIGLIHSSWGGTPAESWTTASALESNEEFAPIIERYSKAENQYPEKFKKYKLELEQWENTVAQAKANGEAAPPKPKTFGIWGPLGPTHPGRPSGLYNAMIAPLIPYGIKGVIWYQGESNGGRGYQYRKLFPAMIKSWREDWKQGDFAFYFVQLANLRCTPAVNEDLTRKWPELREAQLMSLSLPNTGMAVTIDIGHPENIHPKNKQDVGKRLALWALAKDYNKDVVYSGPIYKRMEIEGNKIRLYFDHVDGALIARNGENLKGFEIASSDREFFCADAKIDGETILVSNSKVVDPVAVRYAWAGDPDCNLYNKAGLPASPFRTDEWPGITIDNR